MNLNVEKRLDEYISLMKVEPNSIKRRAMYVDARSLIGLVRFEAKAKYKKLLEEVWEK